MRIISIVGARPQFVKLAPVSRAMADSTVTGGSAIEDIIVHTGQHYDAGMSDVFFDELDIPRPSIHLGVGSGRHGEQTAKMLTSIETALLEQRPDLVIIYGDTNSTLAGAIAAAKLHIPIAHIEAGLRSFNRDMPEEVNRIVADHVSDLLFAPTATAMRNLRNENLEERCCCSGDVMLDAVVYNSALAEERSDILKELELESGTFAVATVHRASNTDTQNLYELLDTFNRIATESIPIVFPAHPRTVSVLKESDRHWQAVKGLTMIEPVLKHARFALTDSGGLQKEALFVGTPCVTLRDETEWPETVDAGGNILTGVNSKQILSAVNKWLETRRELGESLTNGAAGLFGDGNAAAVIVRRILE